MLNGYKMTPKQAFERLGRWAAEDGLYLHKYNAGGGNHYRFFAYKADDYFSDKSVHNSDSIAEMEAFWRGWRARQSS